MLELAPQGDSEIVFTVSLASQPYLISPKTSKIKEVIKCQLQTTSVKEAETGHHLLVHFAKPPQPIIDDLFKFQATSIDADATEAAAPAAVDAQSGNKPAKPSKVKTNVVKKAVKPDTATATSSTATATSSTATEEIKLEKS